jgi:4-hydroxy-tetrahydrodipicolinate reductase
MITLMINGLPGNVAQNLLDHAVRDSRFRVIPFSLTGPGIMETDMNVSGMTVELLKPEDRDEKIGKILSDYGKIIAIDYTHPSAVNQNAEFYIRHSIDFVMGTTGGDREKLFSDVEKSSISAVIAPNMAKQIVGFQAMMEYAADTFPGLFKNYSLTIKESHQKGKADTSGTAKAMVTYFKRLGIDIGTDDIIMEREPEQQKEMGIPEEYLKGHAWHTYTLISDDKTVKFEFTHNINGRDIYSEGTLDAVEFLYKKTSGNGIKGKAFSMIEVLKG